MAAGLLQFVVINCLLILNSTIFTAFLREGIILKLHNTLCDWGLNMAARAIRTLCTLCVLMGLCLGSTGALGLSPMAEAAALQQAPVLPNFKLPYAHGAQVRWTGGPHKFGDTESSSTFVSGLGSGLDFAGTESTYGQHFRVLAIAAGKVEAAQCSGIGGFGCWIAVRHTLGGTVAIYAHLKADSFQIKRGTDVTQGTHLAQAGSEGTTNVHLHLELRRGNTSCPASQQICTIDNFGSAFGWDDLVPAFDGYYIGSYLKDGDGIEAYNYDGSAVLGSQIKVIDQFRFNDTANSGAIIPRTAIVRVHQTFSCPSATSNCEINNLNSRTQFALGASGGKLGEGQIVQATGSLAASARSTGVLLSSNVPVAPPGGPRGTDPDTPPDQPITVVSVAPRGVHYSPGQTFNPEVVVRANGFSLDCGRDFLENRDGQLFETWPIQGCTALGGGQYRIRFNTPMRAPQEAGTYTSRWQIWQWPRHYEGAVEFSFTTGSAPDPNRAPGIPSSISPPDGRRVEGGQAPELCWTTTSDPDGDNVQYYAELVESVVVESSGWTTATCWRPSHINERYYGFKWRVKARDAKSKESDWSERRRFILTPPQPIEPPVGPPSSTPATFGDGVDGPLNVLTGQTVEINQTRVNVSASGSAAAPAFSVGFSVGDVVLFHQTRGTAGAGQYEMSTIAAINAPNSWTLAYPLQYIYDNTNGRAQVIKVPRFTDVTVASGAVLTAPAWDEQTGGVLVLLARGHVDIQGFVTMTGKGFKGGYGNDSPTPSFCGGTLRHGQQGEAPGGSGSCSQNANGGGGGGGNLGSGDPHWGSGGGGGHRTFGGGGFGPYPGGGGQPYGSAALDLLHPGAGGGGGSWGTNPYGGGRRSIEGSEGAGQGGGAILLFGRTIAALNSTVDGAAGGNSANPTYGGYAGGGGAGGSLRVVGDVVTLGDLQAVGGPGGVGRLGDGGDGGDGRIRIEYCSRLDGAAIPLASTVQVPCVPNTPSVQTSGAMKLGVADASPAFWGVAQDSTGVTPLATPITTTFDLTVAAGPGGARLEWEPADASSAASYRVRRTLAVDQPLQTIATISDTIYIDSTVISTPPVGMIVGGCYQIEALRPDGSVVATSPQACSGLDAVSAWVPDLWAPPETTIRIPVNIRHLSNVGFGAADFWLSFDTAVISPTRILSAPLLGEQYSLVADLSASGIVRTRLTPGETPALFGSGTLIWVEAVVTGAVGDETQLVLQPYNTVAGGTSIRSAAFPFDPLSLTLSSGRLRVGSGFSLGDGDGSGALDDADALQALQMGTHQITGSWQTRLAADVTGDGHVDAHDAVVILSRARLGRWPSVPSSTAGAPESPEPKLVLSTTIQGDTVTATVSGEALADWQGMMLTIVYDPTQFTTPLVTVAPALAAALGSSYVSEGAVRIALASEQALSGQGVIASIRFQRAPGAPSAPQTAILLAQAQLADGAGRDFATSVLQRHVLRLSPLTYIPLRRAVYLPVLAR